MTTRQWIPERTGGIVLATLVGVLALLLGLLMPHASLWIVGVGAMSLAAVLLLWQLGSDRLARLLAGTLILVAGVGWPLASAQRHPDLAYENERWTSGPVSGPQIHVSGDRVYTHAVGGTTVLDRATGDELWSFYEEGVDLQAIWLRVTENGSVLFTYVNDSMVYIDRSGQELWRIDGRSRATPIVAYALAEDAVAIGECRPPVPGEESDPCRFYGMLPDGSIGWEREAYPMPWGELEGALASFLGERTFLDNVPPFLLVRESPDADSEIIVLDAASGNELDRLPAVDLVIPVGDLLISVEQAGDSGACDVRASRPGEQVWDTAGMPCIADPYITGPRLYAATPDGESVVTVNLEDGSWRDVGAVHLTNNRVSEWRALHGPLAVPMERTIVFFDGNELEVIDAASGDELWRAAFPTGRSEHPWIVSVGNDTIAVAYRTEPGMNPFFSADLRERGLMIIGYDGITGETIGQVPSIIETMIWDPVPGSDIVPLTWMMSSESAILPAAPGEVYVMRTDDTIVRIGPE